MGVFEIVFVDLNVRQAHLNVTRVRFIAPTTRWRH